MTCRVSLLLVALATSLAGAGPASGAARTASPPATGQVIIIHPLQLLRTADLDFGRITPLAGGTATVAAGGGLSVTGVVAAGGTPHPAAFTGAAQRASIVYIQYPPPTVLNRVGGGASLTVNAFTLQSSNAIATLPGGTLLLATGAGAFTFTLGGTITVAAGQADGIYVANLDVIANYF